MMSHEYKQFSSDFITRFVHFPPWCVNLKTLSLPTCFGQLNLFLYQIMIISLLWKLIERCGATEESNCRESKKHSPCVVGCGTKPETILLKSPGSFPCPFWLSFSCPFLILSLFHGPGLLKLLKFTLFHRSGDDFWNTTWEPYSRGVPNINTQTW